MHLLCLQVRTLQLEMEYIYGGLEEEALDVVGESKAGFQQAISRRGSSDELMLLVAGAQRCCACCAVCTCVFWGGRAGW